MIEVLNRPTAKVRPLALVTAGASALVAMATFDPHLSNLELISFAMRQLLPVAAVVLMVAALVWAIRARLHQVVMRHRVLSIVLVCLIGFTTIITAEAIARSADGVRRDDLRSYRPGLPAIRQVTGAYASTLKRLVSRAAWIADYRQDMAMRAGQAFGAYDVAGAQSYLEAGTTSIGGQGGNDEGSRALAYLSARTVYLSNHDARIRALLQQGEVSPLLIYLMRAAYALDPRADREAALRAEMKREQAALDAAKTGFVACAAGQTTEPVLAWPAPLVIRHLAEVTGDWPAVWGNHAGWCRLAQAAAERRRARSSPEESEDGDVPAAGDDAATAFDDVAHLYWGKLATFPARVTHAPPSADTMTDSMEAMDAPEH